MEAKEQRKMGKAWEHLSHEWRLVDVKRTQGGRGPHSNNILDFISERSNDSQDPRHRHHLTLLLTLWFIFIAHGFVVGHRPPYVHLASCHMMCSQAFLIFRHSSTLSRVLKPKYKKKAWDPDKLHQKLESFNQITFIHFGNAFGILCSEIICVPLNLNGRSF